MEPEKKYKHRRVKCQERIKKKGAESVPGK
jgi:hypothetical protein